LEEGFVGLGYFLFGAGRCGELGYDLAGDGGMGGESASGIAGGGYAELREDGFYFVF
jgi:hypothetical protein